MTARRHLAGGIIVAPGRNKPTAVGFFWEYQPRQFFRGLPDGLHLV